MRNLLATVPHAAREPVAALVRTIFAQPDHATTLAQLHKIAGAVALGAELLEPAPAPPRPGTGRGGVCEGPLARGQGLMRARRQTTLRARMDHDAVALRCPTEAGIGRAGIEREGDRVRLRAVEGIHLRGARVDGEAGHGRPSADAIRITTRIEQIGEPRRDCR